MTRQRRVGGNCRAFLRHCRAALRQSRDALFAGWRTQARTNSQYQRACAERARGDAEHHAPDRLRALPGNVRGGLDFLWHARVGHEHALRHLGGHAVGKIDRAMRPDREGGLQRAAMRTFMDALAQRVAAAVASRALNRCAKR
jgi:hypothetical protein